MPGATSDGYLPHGAPCARGAISQDPPDLCEDRAFAMPPTEFLRAPRS